MIEIRRSDTFTRWFADLRDQAARAVIARRIDRLAQGLFGDVKSVGSGISELRIDHGPGYRVYFAMRGLEIVVLLCAGDKSSQSRDINRARALAEDL
ncbi:MAG: type II toxin-antitoxin system RelE/ParE family toxin [Brevundimonas sp.]|uniref:type II toxin-antitoxin system RelE/ParE family toxin n=1 Tax=Brevundimonas sp. TaxID=1871086 RepID=UPI002732E8D4|nr:type II toxin-antitoxin system RelE/ParE family toxin [Brevundimonas sp.]MDP3403593.1 type II toxin-antitoxin system RelE/ParE family toxin [Brevundimonas sp.]